MVVNITLDHKVAHFVREKINNFGGASVRIDSKEALCGRRRTAQDGVITNCDGMHIECGANRKKMHPNAISYTSAQAEVAKKKSIEGMLEI